jgi:hypothetical protein
MSPEARSNFITWRNLLENDNVHCTDAQRAIVSKLIGQCLRLALILHCVDSVINGPSELSPITLETMDRAIALANWFQEHQLYTWQRLGLMKQAEIIDPDLRRVAVAVVTVVTDSDSDNILLSTLTSKVNESSTTTNHLSPERVGRICSKLGLVKHRGAAGLRSVKIDYDKLEHLKSISKVPKI